MDRRTLAAAGALLLAASAGAADLRVGLLEGIGAPYDVDGKSGLAWTIAADFAKEIGASGVAVTRLPRNRMYAMLAAGEVDVILPSNPYWVKDQAGLAWTAPLYTVSDRIYVKKGAARGLDSIRAFAGKKIGTILGYFYPDEWMKAFESKTIVREDVPAKEQNIQKLEAGRIDGFISEDTIMRYVLKTRPALAATMEEAPLVVGTNDISIAVSAKGRFTLKALDAAFAKFNSNGTAASWLAAYK